MIVGLHTSNDTFASPSCALALEAPFIGDTVEAAVPASFCRHVDGMIGAQASSVDDALELPQASRALARQCS